MSNRRFNIIILMLLVAFFFTQSGVSGCNSGGCGDSYYDHFDEPYPDEPYPGEPFPDEPDPEYPYPYEPYPGPVFKNGDTLEFWFEFNGENYFLYTYGEEATGEALPGQIGAPEVDEHFAFTAGYGHFMDVLCVTPVVIVEGADIIFDARNIDGTWARIIVNYDQHTLKGDFFAYFTENGVETEKTDAYFEGMAVNDKLIDFSESTFLKSNCDPKRDITKIANKE